MISKLTGIIAHRDLKYLVLDVNGVGYKISVTSDTLVEKGDNLNKVTFWTYLAIRENAMDLYGFISIEELNFFELLITISGIGPKTALGIMNNASVHTLQMAIQTGDSSHLTKINGISKKVAEKIIMELKDKIKDITQTPESEKTMRGDADVIEALKALGYRDTESRDALKKIDKEIKDTGKKIKEALKILSK